MQNIAIVSPAHPLRGGIAASTERLARELQTQGKQATIYSFRLQYPDFLFPGKTQYTDDPPPADLTIKTIIHSINPLNWLAAGRQIRRAGHDLIIVRYWLPFMGPCLGSVLRVARRSGRTKVIALVDNLIPHERRPGDRIFTRYFIGAVDAFLVMSRAVGEDVRRFTTAKPVAFSPHPVYDNYGPKAERPEALQKLGLPEGRYLLFFGFIREYKGLDLLLRALADERIRQRDIRLIVAGEYYGKREFYEELIDELEIRDRLHLFNEYIPNEEVRYYFAAANLVAQPYRTATQSGISQLAYHFERPMVVTGVGGLPEIVPHERAGYVVDIDPTAIADSIVDYFDRNREAEMTEGLRIEKYRFSWLKMVEALEELYRQI